MWVQNERAQYKLHMKLIKQYYYKIIIQLIPESYRLVHNNIHSKEIYKITCYINKNWGMLLVTSMWGLSLQCL